jgi:hypothetical protein
MKAYEAWLSAKEGQSICRKSRSFVTIMKVNSCNMISASSISFGVDFSADDWEVVKKKHYLTLTDVEISGMIGDESITNIFREKGIKKPGLFTKIAFEWED